MNPDEATHVLIITIFIGTMINLVNWLGYPELFLALIFFWTIVSITVLLYIITCLIALILFGFDLPRWTRSNIAILTMRLKPSIINRVFIISRRDNNVTREALRIYGVGRFIEEAGIEEFDKDDYGTLYRFFIRNEAYVYVKVKNSTPEADGSFKDYYIRVHPTCRSAQEAVAWSFQLSRNQYYPKIET